MYSLIYVVELSFGAASSRKDSPSSDFPFRLTNMNEKNFKKTQQKTRHARVVSTEWNLSFMSCITRGSVS